MVGGRGTTRDGQKVLLLGLSAENIQRLVDGQPMRLRRETHPFMPEGLEILLLGPRDATILSAERAIALDGGATPITVVQINDTPEGS